MDWAKNRNLRIIDYVEWSKDKTLKLIELMQANPELWNPSLCDSRRDKLKRKEELRKIAEQLGISVPDATKKVQHLRTQYNRESVREDKANSVEPHERYISNWYAYEYLHFLKDSSKPYLQLLQSEPSEVNSTSISDNCIEENKMLCLTQPNTSREPNQQMKQKLIHTAPRDEFSVFGEYIANELRSLKGEKNLLVAKKKIQDVIYDVKMEIINEQRQESNPTFSVFSRPHNTGGKLYASTAHTSTNVNVSHTPTSGMSEIIIDGACHYSNFKVDNQ